MAAILAHPEEATQKVILDNISWETYQRLLAERGENPQPRYSYDHGKLEIMVASYEHKASNTTSRGSSRYWPKCSSLI